MISMISRLRKLFSYGEGVAGASIMLIVIAIGIGGGYIAPYDPDKTCIQDALSPPSSKYILGTDHVGRDILSRALTGVRISLLCGVSVVIPAAVIGVTLGMLSGYYGKWVDHIVMRLTDMFIGFPPLILAIAVVAALGPGLITGVAAVIVIWWPGYARLARSQALTIKAEPYVEAAHALGASDLRIILCHVLPNGFSAILVKMSFDLGYGILYIAALGFLGLGAQPPIPELGSMIAVARHFIWAAPWYPLLPGIFLAVIIIGINLFGEALGRLLDVTT